MPLDSSRHTTAMSSLGTFCVVALQLLAMTLTFSSPAVAEKTQVEKEKEPKPTAREVLEALDPTTRSRWRRHYGVFARQCIPFEDDYVVCPTYNNRYDSSRLTTVAEAIIAGTERRRLRMGPNLTKNILLKPETEDIEPLVKALPRVEIGEWGYIHSGNVVEVIDDDEMMIDWIWLIDDSEVRDEKRDREDELREEAEARVEAEKRQTNNRRIRVDYRAIREKVDFEFKYREELADQQRDNSFRNTVRLVGFNTAGLVKRMRWGGGAGVDGIQIAIVAQEKYGNPRKPGLRYVAVPARWFRDGLTEEQFIDMLDKRGMSVTEFVEFMQNAKRDDPRHADERILNTLVPPVRHNKR